MAPTEPVPFPIPKQSNELASDNTFDEGFNKFSGSEVDVMYSLNFCAKYFEVSTHSKNLNIMRQECHKRFSFAKSPH